MGEVNRVPVNVDYAVHDIAEVRFGSWCPRPDGEPPATQVHMEIRIVGWPHPMTLRIKSKRACDEILQALEFHRNDVWPVR